MSAISAYLTELRHKLAGGDATEHTHRPALQRLLEGLRPALTVVNEPRHTEAGAVDFIVRRQEQPIGWVEAKDIGADLGRIARTDQLKRYLGAYPNLILTDYVAFRLYLNGKLVDEQSLGVVDGAQITSTVERQQAVAALLDTFVAQEVYRPGKPEDLARRMAHFARMAEAAIVAALNAESERGQLHSQMAAFRETLLPDLSEEQFADMYAQTIAYGLFAAKCHHPLGDDFSRWTAARYLPPTNPFLQRLFHELTGPGLDPEVEWVVDGLVSLLRNTEMQAIVEAFARHQQGREDPVVHFYETFLKEYNPRERKIRGVYYTPEPVVSYIVRSVDYLLKTEFDKPLGLADDSVFILDPACGTGTFLYFVIEHIYQTITRGGRDRGAWPGYVRDKLLGRLFGFELLMAPYTIAHLKLAQLLREQGYDFPDDQRLGIYLTNTLEEARFRSETLVQRYISEEAEAAAEVKRDKPIMVVLGNPPYAISSQNRGAWIQGLLEDYKRDLHEKKLNLDDDYIKFIRFAQWRIEQTGHGILAYISNNSYLDGVTHRQMRRSLCETFDQVRILNLHGDLRRKEVSPDGTPDKNVFDIQQGVAIGLFAKFATSGQRHTMVADMYGSRDVKYRQLAESESAGQPWIELQPGPPWYFLIDRDLGTGAEEGGWEVPSVFPLHTTGVQTARDDFAVCMTQGEVREHMTEFADPQIPDVKLTERYGLKDARGWSLSNARAELGRAGGLAVPVLPYAYRPLDRRYVAYDGRVIAWPRRELQDHVAARENLSFLCSRGTLCVDTGLCFCSDTIPDKRLLAGSTGEAKVFPLYLYPEDGSLESGHARRPNLNPAFIADLAGRLGLTFIEDGRGDLGRAPAVSLSGAERSEARERGRGEDAVGPHPATGNGDGSSPLPLSRAGDTAATAGEGNGHGGLPPAPSLKGGGNGHGHGHGTFGPEDVFHYLYAVLHSPTYRTRYAEFLKIDFPRIPLTSSLDLFRTLCDLGAELVALHLLKSPLVEDSPATYPETGSDVVEAVRYDAAHERVYINKTQYFGGIGQALYEFHVGGYQVLSKWLKDRKGRTLSYEDIRHYRQVAAALMHTRRLMSEIDAAIPGWPLP